MFGFIGPNGAGKSTTIRYLATLLKASRGDATVNGFSVNSDPMNVRRSIGYMPDDFGVYDGMKVWEFLDFFAVAYRIGRSQRKKIILDVLELLDLAHKRDDFCERFVSRHEATSLLGQDLGSRSARPDPGRAHQRIGSTARIDVKALLKELRGMGKTILISAHGLSELADCCSSMGSIERGQLLMSGSIDSVYRQIRKNRQVVIRFCDNFDVGVSILRSQPELRDIQIDEQSRGRIGGDRRTTCRHYAAID